MKTSNLLGGAVVVSAFLTAVCLAGMDDPTIVSGQTIAGTKAYTNSFFIRGEVLGVAVKIENNTVANRTNTVAITSADGQTIFSKICTGTNFYPVLTQAYGTDGAAILEYRDVNSSNKTSFVAMPVSSKVTAIVTGAVASDTNSCTVRLIVRQ
jgi:hypothetical protein